MDFGFMGIANPWLNTTYKKSSLVRPVDDNHIVAPQVRCKKVFKLSFVVDTIEIVLPF